MYSFGIVTIGLDPFVVRTREVTGLFMGISLVEYVHVTTWELLGNVITILPPIHKSIIFSIEIKQSKVYDSTKS